MIEQIFTEDKIINKEFYQGVKTMINCLICQGIIENPVQCTKCQHYYCSECINEAKNCPLRCENNEFIKSIPCSQLLSNLKYKCSCGESIGYDDREKHLEKCTKKDFEKYYLYYKEQYEKSKKELNTQKKLKSSYFINTSVHNHPLEIIRRYLNIWYCDKCLQSSSQNIPSYHCTLCDYDLCINCAKIYVKEGNIKEIQ